LSKNSKHVTDLYIGRGQNAVSQQQIRVTQQVGALMGRALVSMSITKDTRDWQARGKKQIDHYLQ
jgi:hypothetical protein